MSDTVILWFRRDLRLSDQPAVQAAAADGKIVPVYVLDDETPGDRKLGAASRWWLHRSLESLSATLEEKGLKLILKRGKAADVIGKLAEEVGAARVHALHHYEPWWEDAEKAIGERIELVLHDGNYLAPPGAVKTGSGTPYKIYTPFWRALKERMPPPEPSRRPQKMAAPDSWPSSDNLDDWNLLPTSPNWAGQMEAAWTPGEQGARDALSGFEGEAASYDGQRNNPSIDGTSRLSPHLHWGEISANAVYDRVKMSGGTVYTFLSELGWRDFAQNLICQFPDYPEKSYRDAFAHFPWRDFRSSMRGCGNYGRSDGCTIASA